MEVTWIQFVIICPLVFLAGFVDSIAGGGGLISLPAFLIAGIPPHLSLGSNKMAALMGSATATTRFARKGFIHLKKVIWFIVAALIGSTIGANLVLILDERIIEYLMIPLLPVVAFYALRSKDMGEIKQEEEPIPEKKAFLIGLAAAFVIGTYDGFYGPGTGTFLLLILTGLAKYRMEEAAGTTKAINLASNAAAFVTFVINGTILYPLAICAGLCSIAGNYLGAGLVMTNGKRIVRPVILLVLAILFVKILFG